MIINKTNCEECIHSKVCKNRDNTKILCERLINSTCQPESNTIKKFTTSGANGYVAKYTGLYKWTDMSDLCNVKIELSCPDFEKRQVTLLRGKK